MAEVVFFTGLGDKLGFALRLLRKKYREGERVAVYGPGPVLARLDFQLWAVDPLEFVPHLRWREGTPPPEHVRALTPIWLLEQPVPLLQLRNAVNLGSGEPAWLAQHDKVAELVGLDASERDEGRRRWRQYEAQGHALTHRPQN